MSLEEIVREGLRTDVERIPCVVPHCKRTGPLIHPVYGPGSEHLCQIHWPLADKGLRKLYSDIRRREKKRMTIARILARIRLWGKIKRQVLERAFP